MVLLIYKQRGIDVEKCNSETRSEKWTNKEKRLIKLKELLSNYEEKLLSFGELSKDQKLEIEKRKKERQIYADIKNKLEEEK